MRSCKSHLLRELVFLFEQPHQPWAKDLYDLFLEMLQCVQEQKIRDASLTQEEFERWQQRCQNILQTGRQANRLTAAQRARQRLKQSKEQNLLDRLHAQISRQR